MDMKNSFIKTSDEATRCKLISLGFREIGCTSGIYTFLNCESLKFSDDIDKSKIKYSDKLCI